MVRDISIQTLTGYWYFHLPYRTGYTFIYWSSNPGPTKRS